MSSDRRHDRLIDTALSQLPLWQPPAGFAARLAAVAKPVYRPAPSPWIPAALRALGLSICISLAAWVGAELLQAGLLSMAALDRPGALAWTLAGAALVLAWRCVRHERLARITS